MSLLQSLSRYMERNQAASRALIKQLESDSIMDMDDFSQDLWRSINDSSDDLYIIEIFNDGVIPFEFIVKLLIKIGFTCEDSVRLMMEVHRSGSIVLAKAGQDALVNLQRYMDEQADKHNVSLLSKIRAVQI